MSELSQKTLMTNKEYLNKFGTDQELLRGWLASIYMGLILCHEYWSKQAKSQLSPINIEQQIDDDYEYVDDDAYYNSFSDGGDDDQGYDYDHDHNVDNCKDKDDIDNNYISSGHNVNDPKDDYNEDGHIHDDDD